MEVKDEPRMHAELLRQSLATPSARHETPAAVTVEKLEQLFLVSL